MCEGSARCLAGVCGQRECASFGLMLCALGKRCFHQGRHRLGIVRGIVQKQHVCLLFLLFLASRIIFQGRIFMAQRITAPETKEAATKKTAMGVVGQSSATHAGPAVKARLVNNQ